MQDFRNIILDFPKQFEIGFDLAKGVKIESPVGGFKNIIFCGMGGSIIPAELFVTLMPGTEYQTSITKYYIHRGYELPKWASSENLVVCTSWSGNTEETLSSYEAARKKGTLLLVLTKGGKLKELAEKDKVPLVLLPREDIPPRMGVGYMFSALYTVLAKNRVIKDETESVKNLKSLNPDNFDNKAEGLAKKISDKIPLVYSSRKFLYWAALWKIFFNENAKIHAFFNTLPGLAHNELAGFNEKNNDKFFTILLLDRDEDARYQKSIKNFGVILNRLNYGNEIVEIKGDNLFEKTFNNYLLAALTSMYLAQLRGVDPAEARVIEEFKNM